MPIARYLAHGDPNPAKHDASAWGDVVSSLNAQAIGAEEQWLWWQMIAAILQLGNVQFDEGKPDAATVLPAAKSAITEVEVLLSIGKGTFEKALTKRKIKAGAEFVEQDLKLSQANDSRDALSKAIYSRLFDYLISKINLALVAGGTEIRSDMQIIGIVDIFGFEVFKVNSLEQLCINFANEKLQALFTKSVFIETLKAYEQDGISADAITYTDNKELIQLFDVPQSGIWALLSEECMVPKGSDVGFTEKLHDAQKKGGPLTAVKGLARSGGFQMAHFAGQVTYSTVGWLDKNKDPLSGDLNVLMQFSDNEILRELFTEEQAPAPGGKQKIKSNKFKGVVDTFRVQLNELYNVLESSQTHFVRCFKPNDSKAANLWQDDTMARQLHTSGVLDALRVARTGYPDRMLFLEFATTFADVAGLKKSTLPPKDQCQEVLRKLDIPSAKYQLGKTRVFLSLGVLDELKTKRTARMAKVCLKIQAAARGMAGRKKAARRRKAVDEALAALARAESGDDIAALRAAIAGAERENAHRSPRGSKAVAGAKARLAELERVLAARKAASDALNAAMNGSDINLLRTALQAASQIGVDADLLKTGQTRLQRLEEEERRRIEEEKRLAAVAAAERAEAERKQAEERKRREEEEMRRRQAEEQAKLAEIEAKKQAEARQKVEAAAKEKEDRAAAERAELEEAERREQQAIAEEEELRRQVLVEVHRRGIQFRSEPADVLEYAVYLGMELKEDIELLWIADEALQADDPEGWEQAESPAGDTYYIHSVTQQVLWQHPLDYSYQQKYMLHKGGDVDDDMLPSGGGGGAPQAAAAQERAAAPPPKPAAPAPAKAAAPSLPSPSASADPGAGSLLSDDQLRTRLQQLLGTRHTDLRSMLSEPSTATAPVQCYVMRHKSRMGATRFDFFMALSSTKDMYCFTGKKTSGTKAMGGASYYTISLDQDDGKKTKGDTTIGKIKSDRKSMDYTLYDSGAAPGSKEAKEGQQLRRELMHVHFLNSLRNRNPGVMHVAVPQVAPDGSPQTIRPAKEGAEGLEERLRVSQSRDPASLQVEVFKNREPKFNAESQMYQLDFRGRATHASCKNIQLTRRDGDQNSAELLMGKVDNDKFNVDFQYPYSALQAFAFALIIFDNSSSSMTL